MSELDLLTAYARLWGLQQLSTTGLLKMLAAAASLSGEGLVLTCPESMWCANSKVRASPKTRSPRLSRVFSRVCACVCVEARQGQGEDQGAATG